MLWKAYLDMPCRIVFNLSHRFIFPLVVSDIDLDCRNFVVKKNYFKKLFKSESE